MTRVAWGILRLVPCSSSANFCYQKPRRNRHYAGADYLRPTSSHRAAAPQMADSASLTSAER